MKNIAIITARGGSKRIPRKNIKSFLGNPIIKYSIDAAINSGCFDEVMVSTDDQEIADLAISLGAKVPFKRSENTSDDFATTTDVIKEVIDSYEQLGEKFDTFCCIYPTAPFVTADKLKNALDKLKISGADSVIPVTAFSFPILRSLKIENEKVSFNWPEYINIRSQDLTPAYHDCGQFYLMKTDKFKEKSKLLTDFTCPIIMPESEVQDIDNEEDWRAAEIKYLIFLNKNFKIDELLQRVSSN
jgi:pseudaminic acid cytidylyltransferase